MLEVRGIETYYGNIPALRGISIDVPEGAHEIRGHVAALGEGAQAVVTAGVTNRRWRRRSLPATMPLPAGRQALRLASIVRHTASFFSLPAATVMHPPISFSFIFF